MRKFATRQAITTVDILGGKEEIWKSSHVTALTWKLAEEKLQMLGRSNEKIVGEIVTEISMDGKILYDSAIFEN